MDNALTRLSVRGFRSLKGVELNPGRETLLIGPNGSGKSNLLSVLRLLPMVRTQSLARYVQQQGGGASLLHYGPATTESVQIEVDLIEDGEAYEYALELGYRGDDSLFVQTETVRGPEETETVIATDQRESGLSGSRIAAAKVIDRWLARMGFFHFHDTSLTSKLRTASRIADTGYLRSDGSNLAAYLLALSTAETEQGAKAWRRINA